VIPLLALLLVTAIWGVTFVQVKDAVQNGGTPGSPVGPLLHDILRPAPLSAPAGQSPAPPRNAALMSNEAGT
jgi:hypothetical protein